MHRSMRFVLPVLLLIGCGTGQVDQAAQNEENISNPDIMPNGKGHGLFGKAGGGGGGGSPIKYHGGPVMEGTVNVYYIWYGNWSGNSATTILSDMASSIGDTPYYKINTGYYDLVGTAKNFVTGHVVLAGQTTDNYSLGTALDDNGIQTVVDNAIAANNWPAGVNDLYFVLTSADVNETTGFCTQYCGWHWYGTISNGATVKYSFVGNPDRCPTSCAAQTTGPNGNAGADGMASIITHELEEANTDPFGTAWYDGRGQEDADKCAWTFGTTRTASNGSKYNVTWGTRQYLVQQEWKVSGGCALQ